MTRSSDPANQVERDPELHDRWPFANILSLGSGAAVARVVGFFATAYLARALGPEGFGIIGYAAALTSYFAVGVQGGFPDAGIREVARHPAQAATIAASAIAVRLVVALAALASLAGVAALLPQSPTLKLVTVLTGLTFVTNAVDTSWVYIGLSRNYNVAVAFILGQLGYAAVVLLVVHSQADVLFVPVALFLGELVAALFLLVPLVLQSGFRIDIREGWALIRGTGSLTISRLLRTLVFNLDVVMIGFYLGEAPVGLYTSGYRICYMVMIVLGQIHAAFLPALAQAARRNAASARAIFQRSVDLTFIVVVPVAAGGAILATSLLTACFGPEYAGGAGSFRVLLAAFLLILISMSVHDGVLVYERTRAEVWVIAAAAALNAVLNIALIPRYALTGAAVSTLAAELLILFGGLRILDSVGIRLTLGGIVRPLIAAGVMGAIVNAVGSDRSVLLTIPAGAVSYIAALALLGGIPPDAWPMFGRRLSEGSMTSVNDETGKNALPEDNQSIWKSPDVVRVYAHQHRLLAAEQTILHLLGGELGTYRMLDLGVGAGRTTGHFAPRVKEYVGVDHSPAMVNTCRKKFSSNVGVTFLVGDARQLGVADGRFDFVLFSFNGLDGMNEPDRERVFREMKRVLRDDGVLCFSTHNTRGVTKAYSFHFPRDPRRLWWEYQRYRQVQRMNGPASRFADKEWFTIKDGAHDFRVSVFYVRPELQITQLEELGFRNVRVFSEKGLVLSDEEVRRNTDVWLYYLCKAPRL